MQCHNTVEFLTLCSCARNTVKLLVLQCYIYIVYTTEFLTVQSYNAVELLTVYGSNIVKLLIL